MKGKRNFLCFWAAVVAVLWLVRLVCPRVADGAAVSAAPVEESVAPPAEGSVVAPRSTIYNPIRGVASYDKAFPDVQDTQFVAAQRYGVSPVASREEAERRKSELVFVGSSPFHAIDKGMDYSIPYLVPRAADLLRAIGRGYLDSLAAKGVPLHRIIVSSVLRTEEDVARLVQRNPNASGQSCHRFGTTFDICYNRYETVSPPGEQRRAVSGDTLKWVLSEVLRDLRSQGRCYVKHEVKQGCFHITTR